MSARPSALIETYANQGLGDVALWVDFVQSALQLSCVVHMGTPNIALLDKCLDTLPGFGLWHTHKCELVKDKTGLPTSCLSRMKGTGSNYIKTAAGMARLPKYCTNFLSVLLKPITPRKIKLLKFLQRSD